MSLNLVSHSTYVLPGSRQVEQTWKSSQKPKNVFDDGRRGVVLVAALVFRLYKHQTYLLLIFLVPRSLCRFLLLHSLLK